jgi:hypothetical protein
MTGNIPKDRRVRVQMTLIVFIIYVLYKIKLYKKCIHCFYNCLYERFVNMYLLSITLNYHTCCGLMLFGNNCPYECRNNCWMFAIRHVWYNAFVNVQCIIECRPEIMKSLLVWPTVLFEATIFVLMMYWKNKKNVFRIEWVDISSVIFLTPCQPVRVCSGETANINFIIFGFTRSGLESTF